MFGGKMYCQGGLASLFRQCIMTVNLFTTFSALSSKHRRYKMSKGQRDSHCIFYCGSALCITNITGSA